VAEKKISLDDPVNKFLPKENQLPKVKDKDILIRNLIVHGSCLPRMPGNFNPPANEMTNPYKSYTEKDLLSFLPTITTGDCELNATPTYSNLGAGLLGYVLTKVSGQHYKDLFDARIARPLNTKSLGVISHSNHWTHGHVPSGNEQSQWEFTDALVGAGGVDASADDMVKLLTFLMTPDQSALGKAVVASTTVQLEGPQGAFGTFWIESKEEIWHNGMTGGFNAFVGWNKGTKDGVFILVNTGEDIATSMGLAILREMR
jgi:CubicO group peptidase (beta-lactamase class C family)